ncbi:MAG TPA: hypothetical protein PKY83_05950 [Bacteroidales bacterium]|jgi:chromosome segregation ATPase|nr:hypothetical protein [Bacteroidales bacterium]MCZ2418096.1 hypothetical protein [Burkholderiales bacterium]MBP8999080.1 hypothetical protein [Bacteroidales bacterium]MBV6455836.1 hypothetical protein [Bacteroidales bacterium]MCZ2317414.1 hypothetical protein [Bacteroidales bacterium]
MKPQHAAIIDPLKQKIETLISLHEKALTENRELNSKLQTLSEEQNIYKKEKEELEQKVQKLQMAGAFLKTSEDTREAKQRIGKLIREIDKCLTMLNR